MMPHAIKPPTLTERVQRALRREGEAGTALLARALGARTCAVQGVVVRGIADGWCRLVRKNGQHGVYALVKSVERSA